MGQSPVENPVLKIIMMSKWKICIFESYLTPHIKTNSACIIDVNVNDKAVNNFRRTQENIVTIWGQIRFLKQNTKGADNKIK